MPVRKIKQNADGSFWKNTTKPFNIIQCTLQIYTICKILKGVKIWYLLDPNIFFNGKILGYITGQNHRYCFIQARSDFEHCQQDLVKKHSDAYEGLRSYFNDVTANTLDLIMALKTDAADMKKRENAAEVLAIELAQENKKLVEPLMLVCFQFSGIFLFSLGQCNSAYTFVTN